MATWGSMPWENETARDFVQSLKEKSDADLSISVYESIVNSFAVISRINAGEKIIDLVDKRNVDAMIEQIGPAEQLAEMFGWSWDGDNMYAEDNGGASGNIGYISSAIVAARLSENYELPETERKIARRMPIVDVVEYRRVALDFVSEVLKNDSILRNWFDLPGPTPDKRQIVTDLERLLHALS